MGDELQHVSSRDPLRIPAARANAWTDAAIDFRRRRNSRPGGALGGAAGADRCTVLVRNDSGEDVERFDVLGLGDAWPSPDDNEVEFLAGAIFKGALPSVATHAGRFCVVTDALLKDEIGLAVIGGIVPVYVNVLAAGDLWADVSDGEHGNLKSTKSGATGGAQLLYKSAAGTGVMWCLARLGPPPLPAATARYQVLAANQEDLSDIRFDRVRYHEPDA
jgi:hypothetical protein